MSDGINREPMLEMFIFETVQLVEQLEQAVLSSERDQGFSIAAINQIFRIMHTIKSSAAMMLFKNISSLAHATEDLFYFIRENKPDTIDHSGLTDIVLECVDYIKGEMDEIQKGRLSDREATALLDTVKVFLEQLKASQPGGGLPIGPREPSPKQQYYIPSNRQEVSAKQYYKAVIFFEDGCEMENVRAFAIVHSLKGVTEDLVYDPEDIIANEASAEVIRQNGFTMMFASDQNKKDLQTTLMQTAFISRLELSEWDGMPEQSRRPGPPRQILLDEPEAPLESAVCRIDKMNTAGFTCQSMISVSVDKLDKLMDVVGELVITQAMVTQNRELAGLPLDSFYKSARQLQKLTHELQDTVMAIRMVPLSPTFHKMNRIVRDAGKSLQKEVKLNIVGEETEVDKNIIEHISDPLMHLIRNALDHGIEPAAEREAAGKPRQGTITLEAKNAGGEVWILVRDDGRGLDRDRIIKKARANGLTSKTDSELTDKEIYSFIFLPGFSTKETVTELSGRGVGMDVVTKNIEKIGGMVQIDSTRGEGTTIAIRIPLTLAIIDGMTIRVGQSRYTVPTVAIQQSFRPQPGELIVDPDGNEMMIIRGICYPVLRLHERYQVATEVTDIYQGIIVLVEHNGKGACLFADELLGQQQVVIKALPRYIKKVEGLAGCALLGDGHISLILDMESIIRNQS